MVEIAGDAGVAVDPHNSDDLAEAMYKVLTDAELKNNLNKKALTRAKLFSWERCARDTLKVYEELYRGKSSQG